jgi:hypothetical protein
LRDNQPILDRGALHWARAPGRETEEDDVLTKGEARALVVAELQGPLRYRYASHPTDLVIVDESTIEREWGWVFFYTSDRYLKTRDVRYALAGNAPYIVNRHTGAVRVTGTARPIEHYIAEYERELVCG